MSALTSVLTTATGLLLIAAYFNGASGAEDFNLQTKSGSKVCVGKICKYDSNESNWNLYFLILRWRLNRLLLFRMLWHYLWWMLLQTSNLGNSSFNYCWCSYSSWSNRRIRKMHLLLWPLNTQLDAWAHCQ